MKGWGAVTVVAVALVWTAGAEAVSLDWVFIGDAGNAGELSGVGAGGFGPNRICGAVDYDYYISKYEITNGQYREFLNAVAAEDTYGLYHVNMGSTYGGITQNGSPGDYTYAPKGNDPNWDAKPANYVSYYDCLRFANWLHNGQPSGAQTAGTTEDGAYTFSGLTTVSDRNPEAKMFLTSEDEWYKAAFYKGGGTDAGYWDYATQRDTKPDNNPPASDSGNSVNYYNLYEDDYAAGPPYYSTDVGAYTLSGSAYGTFDQNGNMWEWNEALLSGAYRGLRGGSWSNVGYFLPAAWRYDVADPEEEIHDTGFRVAMIPEPSAVSVLIVGVALLRWRRR